MHCIARPAPNDADVPDRQDTAGLGKTSLLLDTADPLLEDGRDLGRRGLGLGVGADLDKGRGSAGLAS